MLREELSPAITAVRSALSGRTSVLSGGSRGIGLAILVAAARRGANAVLLAKTDKPHPRLPGIAHTAVAEIEAANGKAVAVAGDVRGTFTLTRACLPYLRASDHAHVLSISPPLNLADAGIAASCLWPQTRIATAVIMNLMGGPEAAASSRSPRIMADATMEILTRPPSDRTGQTLIDAEVLAAAGVHDLSGYGGGDAPALDLYIDPPEGNRYD